MTVRCRPEHAPAGGIGIETPIPQLGIDTEQLLGIAASGDRPYTLINFFATWCRPCRKELPDLVALAKDSTSNVKVVLISLDKMSDVKSKLHNFLNEYGVDFQTYARTQGEADLIRDFYVYWDGRIPLTLILDQNGGRIAKFIGQTSREAIEAAIAAHARKNPQP